MKGKVKLLAIIIFSLIVLALVTFCIIYFISDKKIFKTEKDKFIEQLEENKGFKCDESLCSYEYEEEKHNNGIDHYLKLGHFFDFDNELFNAGYAVTDFKNNDIYYEDSWGATYYYSANNIYSRTSNYEYNYQTNILTNKEVYSMQNKTYNCSSENEYFIREKCSYLREKCETVKGMFYTYLGDYSVDDLLN